MTSSSSADPVHREVKDEAVYEVPTEGGGRSDGDIRPRTTTNGSNAYAEFDNPLYQPN